MHICILSNLYKPEVIGGAEKHAVSDAQKLVNRGHRVSVLTTISRFQGQRRTFEHEFIDGVDVFRFTPANMYAPIDHPEEPFWKKPIQHTIDLWNPHVYYLIKQKLSSIQPDVVHVHNYAGLSPAVFRAAGILGLPIVHTLHDHTALHVRQNLFANGSVTDPGLLVQPYQRFHRFTIEPYLSHVIGPSQYILDRHQSEGFFADTPTTHLPYGNELPEYEGESTTCPPSRDEPLRLLYVGRLSQPKGVDLLIKAINALDEVDFQLDILGSGPQRESLERLVNADDRVQFHGFCSGSELHSWYANSHLTIVPSRCYDNSPMVIYESYGHGIPVIGANIGGIPELVDHGTTGFVFPPDDTDALAATIRDARRKLGPEMYTAAQERANECTSEHHIDELIQIYSQYIY